MSTPFRVTAVFLAVLQLLAFISGPVLATCCTQDGQPLDGCEGQPQGGGCWASVSHPAQPGRFYTKSSNLIPPIATVARSGCDTTVRIKNGSYNLVNCGTCFSVCCTQFLNPRGYGGPGNPTTASVSIFGQGLTLPTPTTDPNTGETVYTMSKPAMGLGRIKVTVPGFPKSAQGQSDTPDKTLFVYPRCAKPSARPAQASTGVKPKSTPMPCPNCPTVKGDPVDEYSRAYVYAEEDLNLPGLLGLNVVRNHDSTFNSIQGEFGTGTWLGTYAMRVIYPLNSQGKLQPSIGTLGEVDFGPGGNSGNTIPYRCTNGSNLTFVNNVELGTTGDLLQMTRDSQNFPTGATYTTRKKDVFSFNAAGYLTQIKDRNNNIVTLARDVNNRLLSVTDTASNRSLAFTYSGSGFIQGVTDHTNRTVSYGYTGNNLTSVTNPLNQTITFTWDANNRITVKVDRKNTTVLTNTYDADGLISQQTDAIGGTYQFASPTEDDRTFTNPNGDVIKTRYNDLGYVEEVVDGLNHTNKIDYTDNVFTQTTSNRKITVTDPLNRKVETSVNLQNNPISVKDPLNQTVTLAYGNSGNPDRVTQVTDKKGHITTLAYDAAGNLTSVTTPDTKTTTYTYNSKGQVLTVTNPLNKVTTMTYATNGDLLTITDPLNRQTQMTYDTVGRLATVTDPKNHVTTYTYDALDRLLTVTNALNQTTTFAYDANDNLVTRTDANNHITTYTYDFKNRLVDTINPLSQTRQTLYDPGSRVTSTTDAKGQTTQYTYDAANRLTQIAFAGGVNYTYAYDNADQLLSVTDGTGTWGFTYDLLGRTTQVTTPDGTTGYAYDPNNNRTTLTGPGNYGTVAYAYDNMDRLTSQSKTRNVLEQTRKARAIQRVSPAEARTHPITMLAASNMQ